MRLRKGGTRPLRPNYTTSLQIRKDRPTYPRGPTNPRGRTPLRNAPGMRGVGYRNSAVGAASPAASRWRSRRFGPRRGRAGRVPAGVPRVGGRVPAGIPAGRPGSGRDPGGSSGFRAERGWGRNAERAAGSQRGTRGSGWVPAGFRLGSGWVPAGFRSPAPASRPHSGRIPEATAGTRPEPRPECAAEHAGIRLLRPGCGAARVGGSARVGGPILPIDK